MASLNIEILNNAGVYLYRYVVPILYATGNCGTILSAFVFSKKSWRKNVCVFYFNICLLINLGYINSSMLGSIFTFGFNIHAENSSVILCKLFYYVSYLFAALLPNILILASIDRLLISSQNVDTRLYSSKRLAYFLISISTLFWVIFYIHTLIKVSIYQIYPSPNFVCYYETSGVYFDFVSYSTFIISVGFAVVLIVLSILTFKNVPQIQSVPQNRMRTMNKKDFQLLRCLHIYDIIYIIFNVFPSGYDVYLAATKDQTRTSSHQAIDNFLDSLSIFTHHIPYCASFFIFISVSKAFRQGIKRLVYKMCGTKSMAKRNNENRQQNNARENVELNVVSTVEL